MWGALGEDTGEEGGGWPLHGLWATVRPLSFIWRVVEATGGFRQRCGQLGAALGKSWESEDWSNATFIACLFVCLFLFNSSLFPHMNMLVFPLRKNKIGFSFGLDSSKKLVCYAKNLFYMKRHARDMMTKCSA